jgi:hypothetical protein
MTRFSNDDESGEAPGFRAGRAECSGRVAQPSSATQVTVPAFLVAVPGLD